MTILHVMTVPMSLTFLRGQVGYMKARGFSLHALASPGEELEAFEESEGVPVHAVPMTRHITPWRDLVAVREIWRVIRRVRPSIVHAHTPKGGLLAMLAASLASTPVRIYQMRGLPLVTATGFRRRLLRWTEKLTCRLAHRVICNSHSLRGVAIEEGICPPEKIQVLLGGSGNGVDAVGRFNPAAPGGQRREEVRCEWGIPEEATVIGFVGRIVREKGIGELADAWQDIRQEHPLARLLIVGPYETQDPVPGRAVANLQSDRRVHMIGMEWDTPPLYRAMDLVVLPTYREGFPNVPLEAAAMNLPVVATSIPGCVDAVADGKTGLLVPPRDARALAAAMRTYLEDPDLREQHGAAGRARVLREFRQEAIWEAIHGEYLTLTKKLSSTPSGFARVVAGDFLKRAFDVAGSAFGILFLSPLLAFLALMVRVRIGSPVLFRQERPGKDSSRFTIYKFRTMREVDDEHGNPLPDDERLSSFGRLLRQTSLDELPELWNVLKGEMSLVGPRPLLVEYLPLYTEVQARRHEIRPGMTGWAQVHGRNDTTWEKRLALDVWYVENRTLRLDLEILFRTLLKVILREGINQKGSPTMKRFRGSPV